MTDQPQKRKPATKGKFFDVMRPGKTPASSTSRPVITGKLPKVQDITLKVRSVRPTPNSRTAEIQPRIAAPAPEKLLPEHGTPDEDSLFSHVDDGPIIPISGLSRSRRILKVLLIVIGILILVAVVVDLLLDANIIKTSLNIPHTNFIK